MFWKKWFGEKPIQNFEYVYVEKAVQGSNLEAWLKMPQAQELINWIENLENSLKVGLLDKTTVTNEELWYRKGEVNALKKFCSLIKNIRFVKPETDETEETNG